MLRTLRIRNLALVADLTLDFHEGLNVLTGETGAGKSVVLGALNLVLGQRADRTAIRTGTDQCTVEAVFEISGLPDTFPAFLEENGVEPCTEGQLLLKRSFSATGINRQFINGSPTTLATLATLGSWLVDLHGPHEHQSLLQPARQLAILDAYGALEPARATVSSLVRRRTALEQERATLVVDDRSHAQQLDLIRHQVREITDARLLPGEDVSIEAEHHRVRNSARLLELSQSALDVLSESEEAAMSRLAAVGRAIQEIVRLDPTAGELGATQSQATDLLRELQHSLAAYADRTEVDPVRLAELEQRLDLLQSLKRKYGPTLEAVIDFGLTARIRLTSLEGREAEMSRIDRELGQVIADLHTAARALSKSRSGLLSRLSRGIQEELAALGFQQSKFSVSLAFEGEAVTATGGDVVEFQFSPNPGEPPRPLRTIASSGELARVMLALKTVLAAEDEVPVLVFDEVDANVGGETAHAVGQKMRQIARKHQVLCITHLPQVAAQATHHYVVLKEVNGGRTETRVVELEDSERAGELARMLGGGPAALRHGRELLNAGRRVKAGSTTG